MPEVLYDHALSVLIKILTIVINIHQEHGKPVQPFQTLSLFIQDFCFKPGDLQSRFRFFKLDFHIVIEIESGGIDKIIDIFLEAWLLLYLKSAQIPYLI